MTGVSITREKPVKYLFRVEFRNAGAFILDIDRTGTLKVVCGSANFDAVPTMGIRILYEIRDNWSQSVLINSNFDWLIAVKLNRQRRVPNWTIWYNK